MENLTVALEFLTHECKVHLVNIGPNDIHDGNSKLILGLIWAMILHFKIKAGSGDDGNANKELLAWVNSQIPSYAVKNFTSDWQNGKSICALADVLCPGHMKLPRDFTNDPVADTTLGVKHATDNMAIPLVMDVEDIVHHPDQHSMMTYISYFREYALTHELHKQKDLEMTPDISKCIVYGPGLEPGNDADKETYLTIEIRNAADRKVPSGGHNIFVRITGPHTQSKFNAVDNLDGTYYVTYTPGEDGNYVVEVRLDDKPIQSSPFHVTINPVKGPVTTEPKPHWFVQDIATQKWVPYDQDINQEIEAQFAAYGGGMIQILNNMYRIDLSGREEINLTKKHLLGSHERRPVIRGTWFWKTDDATWCPYSEEICVILEKGYKDNKFTNGAEVDISEKKKQRFVKEEDGAFNQYRKAHDAKLPRPVHRGYLGQVIEKELPKKK